MLLRFQSVERFSVEENVYLKCSSRGPEGNKVFGVSVW